MSSDVLAEWISHYGLALIFATTFASCLAAPVPASLVMMTAGTLSASGEFSVVSLLLAGTGGAIAGDQAGYQLARSYLATSNVFSKSSKWQKSLEVAYNYQEKWGAHSIFLSRWLASPLGPWINFTSGLTRYNRTKFTLWAMAGEIIWVCVYVGLGYVFSTQIQTIADLVGNAIWLVIAVILAVIIGRKIFAGHNRLGTH